MTTASELGEQIKREAGQYDCNYEALHSAVDRLVALAQGPAPAGQWIRCRVCGTPDMVDRCLHETETKDSP